MTPLDEVGAQGTRVPLWLGAIIGSILLGARRSRCSSLQASLGRVSILPARGRTPGRGWCARCDICMDSGARRAAPSAPLDIDHRERRTRDRDLEAHS